MNECARCEGRGKVWKGSDPVCGFDENGAFKGDNWNCATLNELRSDRFRMNFMYNGCDETALILNGKDMPFIGLCWYKSRGRVSKAIQFDSDELKPLTLNVAEDFLKLIGEEE